MYFTGILDTWGQIVLIALIVLVMPRSSTVPPETFSARAEALQKTIPAGSGSDAYAVIFDAGSTGPVLLKEARTCGRSRGEKQQKEGHKKWVKRERRINWEKKRNRTQMSLAGVFKGPCTKEPVEGGTQTFEPETLASRALR
jgi:hypothetical protein